MIKPFFSIVLPTYNRCYSVKQIFLPSLEKQSWQNYELIIVDDASTDETKPYINSAQFSKDFPSVASRTKYIRNYTNRGAPGSRNVGAESATADWIYIVEDDIQIDSDSYMIQAKEICEKQPPTTAVVSPKRMEGVLTGYYHNPKNSFARLGLLSGEVYIDPQQEYSGFVPSTHASSFIRREVFLKHKEDDVNFFGNTFRDESDLYIRITRDGYKIWYCADKLKTLHRNDIAKSGGQKKVNNLGLLNQELMLQRNHYLYLKKHYSLAELRILVFALVRLLKILARITKIDAVKDILAWVRI